MLPRMFQPLRNGPFSKRIQAYLPEKTHISKKLNQIFPSREGWLLQFLTSSVHMYRAPESWGVAWKDCGIPAPSLFVLQMKKTSRYVFDLTVRS